MPTHTRPTVASRPSASSRRRTGVAGYRSTQPAWPAKTTTYLLVVNDVLAGLHVVVDGVLALLQVDRVVPGAAVVLIRLPRRRGVGSAVEVVIAYTGPEHVLTLTAVKGVVAPVADQGVDPPQAVDGVVPVLAVDDVRARRAMRIAIEGVVPRRPDDRHDAECGPGAQRQDHRRDCDHG